MGGVLAPAQADTPKPRPPRVASATPIYRAVTLALDRRRNQLGMSMAMLDDLAGLHDGYWAKLLHADGLNGRVAGWDTIQYVFDVLFPDGFHVTIEAKSGASLDVVRHKLKVRWGATMKDQRSASEWAKEIGAKGASKGGKARSRKLGKRRRRQIARMGGKARARLFKHAPTTGKIDG